MTALKKIMLTAPKGDGGKWRISFGGGTPFLRESPVAAYRLVERKIGRSLASQFGVKTRLRVNYGDGYTNEGDYEDMNYLLFALQAFVEDYLPESFRRDREKKYWPKE